MYYNCTSSGPRLQMQACILQYNYNVAVQCRLCSSIKALLWVHTSLLGKTVVRVCSTIITWDWGKAIEGYSE